ncbi:MAG TPA: AtpZ/AtpI family protein [Spirochaetota bacterium]
MKIPQMNGTSLKYSSAGIELVLFVLLFFGGGYWLDRKFGTLPVFALIGGIVGIIIGFYMVFRALGSDDNGSGSGRSNTPK